ncbi:hypothetical protein U1Q18_026994 [Sarracenia purpurea var. burkii]
METQYPQTRGQNSRFPAPIFCEGEKEGLSRGRENPTSQKGIDEKRQRATKPQVAVGAIGLSRLDKQVCPKLRGVPASFWSRFPIESAALRRSVAG